MQEVASSRSLAKLAIGITFTGCRTLTSQGLQNKGALGGFSYAGNSVMPSATVTEAEDLE